MTCVSFLDDGNAVTGGTNGMIYLWSSGRSLIKAAKVHQGAIHSLWAKGDKILTGGSDKRLILCKSDLTK